jgi:hypothetical protein
MQEGGLKSLRMTMRGLRIEPTSRPVQTWILRLSAAFGARKLRTWLQ